VRGDFFKASRGKSPYVPLFKGRYKRNSLFKDKLLVIGMISGKHWTGVITYRGEKIRIISIRRSRKEEVEIYEGERI
jgi:uncharacterized DUF497 family protein